MKKIAATLSCLLLGTAQIHAQTPATDIDPALWVVKDADTTIYLFGTIHMLQPGLGWFDDGVKQAFDASDELVIEMIEPDQATTVGAIRKLALDPAGKPLSQKLGEAERAKYKKMLEANGLPAQAFDQARPWFAAMSLSAASVAKLGYDPANGPEKILITAAGKAGKKVGQLETIEEQLGFFNTLTEQEQIDYLNVVVDMQDDIASGMKELIDVWGKADLRGFARVTSEGLASTPALDRALLGTRNVAWANWIKTRLDTPGTVFMAVGAGHLAGKGSVQDHLKALRIKSARVNY